MASGRRADAGEPPIDDELDRVPAGGAATATLVADAPELPDDLDGEPLVELDHPPALDVRRLGLILSLLSLVALFALVWVGRADDTGDLLDVAGGAVAAELAAAGTSGSDGDATTEPGSTGETSDAATTDDGSQSSDADTTSVTDATGAAGGDGESDRNATTNSEESSTGESSSGESDTGESDTGESSSGESGDGESGDGDDRSDASTQALPPAGDVSLELVGDTVLLNGSVADAATAQSLTARLAAIVGPERVRDNTTIDPAATVPSTVEVVLRDGLDFAPDDASITSRAGRDAVALLGQLIDAQPDAAVTVAGHTDSEGPSAYNIEIARQRVFSVLRLLVGYDVYVGDIAIELVGEAEPIATNATEAGRALNRRVEVTIDGLFTD